MPSDLPGDLPNAMALSLPGAISSRSEKDKKRAESGVRQMFGMPPLCLNQRAPTAGDTPATTAALSLDKPCPIAFQKLL